MLAMTQNHVECTVCEVCDPRTAQQPPFEVRCPCWFAVQPMGVGAGIHHSRTIAPSEGELVQCGIWEGHGDVRGTVEQGRRGDGLTQEVL